MKIPPHPVDVHVGARLREARKQRGFSQQTLAKSLDVTFQQLQKYENASNRISASKLYEVSKALNVDPGWFFDGMSG